MSTRPTRSRSRDESGVIAVLVALMAIVLLGIAALAVDMGNAYARKRLDVTDESDFASHLAIDASTRNGIVANNSQLSLVQVYAFSADALPATADATGSTLPYLGAGPRVVRLVE